MASRAPSLLPYLMGDGKRSSLLDEITAFAESRNRNYSANGGPLVSPAGARFAMQVMPGTAKAPGFGVAPVREHTADEYNRVGREYRAAMEKRYGGDPAKMWAAYNWGPGNLDNAIAKHGERWLDAAPAETRNYVSNNMNMMQRRAPNPIERALSPSTLDDLTTFSGVLSPSEATPEMQFSTPQQIPAPKGRAFHRGGVGWAILGSIGDALSAYGGRPGVFAPAMMQRNEQQAQEERFRRRLEAERLNRLEVAKAAAMKPDEITNSAGDRIRLHPDGRQEVIYMDPYGKPRTESRVNPATGALEVFNTGSTPRPTADDIADLRRDPNLASDFDAEFGPGASAYILRGVR